MGVVLSRDQKEVILTIQRLMIGEGGRVCWPYGVERDARYPDYLTKVCAQTAIDGMWKVEVVSKVCCQPYVGAVDGPCL